MDKINSGSVRIHHGHNVKRFREMLDMKQEALAMELGNGWSQKRISLLEAKEVLDSEIISQVATALKIPENAIKNFNEESAINFISNTFSDFKDNSSGINVNCTSTFNAIDRLMESIEENRKLYERLLQSEQEKIEILKAKGN